MVTILYNVECKTLRQSILNMYTIPNYISHIKILKSQIEAL